jgi:sucrose phosphorylase
LKTLKTFLDRYLFGLVNTVHILPFYPYSSDDGFSVIDYKAVDEKLGGWEDIALLGRTYRLMFDAVINHISKSSEWLRGYLAKDPAYHDFFIEVDPTCDLSAVVRPRTLPLLHAYKDVDGKKRWLWTTFSEDQIDLNYANYHVLLAILDILLFYVDKGAALIRLDAVAFLWKEIGTSSIHLPQTHRIIQLMRLVLRSVRPDILLVTETNVPHAENISYFGNGRNEADMVYNFALPPLLAYTMQRGNTRKLREWAQGLTLPSDKVSFFNFTASHDGCGLRPVADILDEEEITALVEMVKRRGGYISYRDAEEGKKVPYELNASYIDIVSDPEESVDVRTAKMVLTQAVALAMPGVPGIYFHSLVGSTGDREAVERSGEPRAINRQKFTYDALAEELEREGSLRNGLFTKYAKLLRTRADEPLFHPHMTCSFPDMGDALFAIERVSFDGEKKLLALYNFTKKPILYNIQNHADINMRELLLDEVIESYEVTVPAYGVMWIKSEKGNI